MAGAMAGVAMAKAKAGVRAGVRRGRPPARDKSAKTLGYRVSPDYLAWITKAARVNRSSIAGLIDQAVARYARDIGVADAPPDRTA
jgi:hypothetical protein